MSFVDFVIIGAMKCGTTTLSRILAKHPDVCFCQKKEPHFFSKNSDWQNNLEEYRSLYQPQDNQICGEASTTYTFYPVFNVAPKLYQFNPKLKLIYIMRNPYDRVVSQYLHCYSRSYTSLSLEQAILTTPGYINLTRYFVQIKPYLELFGREQILLLTLEEFANHREETLAKIADFLNIDARKFEDADSIHANQSIGNVRHNIKIEKMRRHNIISTLKPFVPELVKKTILKGIYRFTDRKIQEKPIISDYLKTTIANLVTLDVLEIEKLMGRKLEEWDLGDREQTTSKKLLSKEAVLASK